MSTYYAILNKPGSAQGWRRTDAAHGDGSTVRLFSSHFPGGEYVGGDDAPLAIFTTEEAAQDWLDAETDRKGGVPWSAIVVPVTITVTIPPTTPLEVTL
jgi:hypothetical protein